MMIIILDSGVIHTICNPSEDKKVTSCQKWFEHLMTRGCQFVISEICDYEVRRELIRRNKIKNQKKLDELRAIVTVLPLTQEVLLKAAKIWAITRQDNSPTSDDRNIDVDMIISAQYLMLEEEFPGQSIIVATTNTKHLKLFTNAEEWENITF
jgi:predicted nucleic acid-binding protein